MEAVLDLDLSNEKMALHFLEKFKEFLPRFDFKVGIGPVLIGQEHKPDSLKEVRRVLAMAWRRPTVLARQLCILQFLATYVSLNSSEVEKAIYEGDEEKGRSEMPRLANLRFYDLRHQFVTELCEAGVPEAVIRELAGHVDPQMMRIYSHPRLTAKRLAVGALATVKTGQSEGGYVTNHVTKALPAASGEMEVIEKNGRGAQI